MAKIRHNNFIDTVDSVSTEAGKRGVMHLHTQGSELNGRTLLINGKTHFHFGTTGYLGLEQDARLKEAAIDAIRMYGTQFPLSKTYISHPLYSQLEELTKKMYGFPVVITKNSTLCHLGVIPTIVRDEDGVIIDHQVHWSVQNACQILKSRNIPVEMIRHNRLDMLEDKIKELTTKCDKIWYMADGIYSMFGDTAPIDAIMSLAQKYPQLHLYFDDVHGMSWSGPRGTGYVMSQVQELPENVMLITTLSKTFGASGALFVTANDEVRKRFKNFGGPLTFSAQLEPSAVGAAIASAEIHLTDEIYTMQQELMERIRYFNELLDSTDLPLVEPNISPVRFIGTGIPETGYNLANRLMQEGFYTNLGIFPAVPIKNTGIRVTISRHNQKEEIKGLVEALDHHYPLALAETHTTKNKVRRDFKLPLLKEDIAQKKSPLTAYWSTSIATIEEKEWHAFFGHQSVFDWEGMKFLEEVFTGNTRPEHNYEFHYLVIRNQAGKAILATFFTRSLWKDDVLAPVSVSQQMEERRKKDPYYMTSEVMAMGTMFTVGQHLFLDQRDDNWQEALRLMSDELDKVEGDRPATMRALRDFEEEPAMESALHQLGYIKIDMPESCVLEDLSWSTKEEYMATLSKRSKKHFKTDIEKFEPLYHCKVVGQVDAETLQAYQRLFENVKSVNLGLNTFNFPEKLFAEMNQNPLWEFIELRPVDEPLTVAGVMFCYKNGNHTYVPSFVGMDYSYVKEAGLYRQLLYQTIVRASAQRFTKIDFGMTASFEKRKVGASIRPKVAYIQASDNYNMELLSSMEKSTT